MNRSPIVVVLGHVDHGKTTLLDYLRRTNIASKEIGGITQHIRSFQYLGQKGETITFIDTPGHAAFSQMRQRGSNLADIAILLIAADDGVMPQTIQSISYIQKADIPFIVAISKTDLPTADIDKIKNQLSTHAVLLEGFGGNVPYVEISAKTGTGISELIDLIWLVWQMSPMEENNDKTLQAIVVESRLDANRGPLAAVIVKSGILTVGMDLYQQEKVGKVKALVDSDGRNISQVISGQPAEILGLFEIPQVGSLISNIPQLENSGIKNTNISHQKFKEEIKVKYILKTDTAGSLEAVKNSLPDTLQLIESGVGDVSEGDVLLAKTSQAQILAFNVRIPNSVNKLAQIEKISIHDFKIIYQLLEYVEKVTEEDAQPTVIAEAKIVAEFTINNQHVAGCKIITGQFSKSDQLQLLRQNQPLYQMHFKSLQQGRNAVERVKSGQEFGAQFSPSIDFKIGDSIITTG